MKPGETYVSEHGRWVTVTAVEPGQVYVDVERKIPKGKLEVRQRIVPNDQWLAFIKPYKKKKRL